MKFEFDPAKRARNKAKHGVDFIEAQALWNDENLLALPLRFEDERRIAYIGCMDGRPLDGHRHVPGQGDQNYFRAQVAGQ